jgi:hypothetical protein
MSEDKKKVVKLIEDELKEIKAGMPYEKPGLVDFEGSALACTGGSGGCTDGIGGCDNGGGCGNGDFCDNGGGVVTL